VRALHVLVLAAGGFAAGCASFAVNPAFDAPLPPSAGYRFENLEGGGDADSTFLVLTASGGGTRAAAFTYGAMAAMHETEIAPGRNLLGELDVLSSVSGGSFAAAYYGLFPDDFLARFPDDVLYRPIQTDLLLKALAPWNLLRVASPSFSRSDLAVEYYDEEIFRHRSYDELPRRRPWIVLNATDLSSGAQFSFTQEQFDPLCSNLGGVSVATGVTASSAFPIAFPPLTLRNYPKSTKCGYETPVWAEMAGSDFEVAPERWSFARSHREYEDDERRPYLHLSDGGLADNIGLRPLLNSVDRGDSLGLYAGVSSGRIKRLAVIVVDAKPRGEPEADRSPRPPGFTKVLEAAATRPMENYSSESVQRMRLWFDEWDKATSDFAAIRSRCDARGSGAARCRREFGVTDEDRPPHPELYIIHVRFDAVPDEYATDRKRLESVPTALELPRKDVDLLVGWARRLLAESLEYQRLVRDLRGNRQASTD